MAEDYKRAAEEGLRVAEGASKTLDLLQDRITLLEFERDQLRARAEAAERNADESLAEAYDAGADAASDALEVLYLAAVAIHEPGCELGAALRLAQEVLATARPDKFHFADEGKDRARFGPSCTCVRGPGSVVPSPSCAQHGYRRGVERP